MIVLKNHQHYFLLKHYDDKHRPNEPSMSVVANHSNGSGIGLLRGIKHGLRLLTGEGGATTPSTSARGRGNIESRPSSTRSIIQVIMMHIFQFKIIVLV